MCSLNWDNQSALINEIIPLPPCILSELSGDLSDSTEIYPNSEYQLGFDESLYGALLDINELKPCKSNVVCSDSIPIMRNPARMITQSMMRDAISENCTRNPNFVKKCIDDFPEQQFRANKCSSRVPKRFEIAFESESRSKKQKTLPSVGQPAASISFSLKGDNVWEPDEEAMAEVKEMIYMEAAMRPINLGIDKPIEKTNKRKNVRISSDPQTVSARKRRERISERLGLLQRLVPGGDKLDTASMLDEAANYLKFLQSQVKELETIGHTLGYMAGAVINPMQSITLPPLPKPKP